PRLPLHFLLTLHRKGCLYPRNHILEVHPQLVRLGLVLMLPHVIRNVAVANPIENSFEKLLADGRPLHEVASNLVRGATSLTKMLLGVRQPRTRIRRIAKFLRS